MRILIAEDEEELARGLRYLLEKNKFIVDTVYDGEAAWEYLRRSAYDVVVLDIMMPKRSGLEVLSGLRREGIHVPVLMLTAKAGIEDRVAGLDAGADDYLAKPFATREFIARIRALSRRSEGYAERVLQVAGVRLDLNRYELACKASQVRLNNKEFQLAELFMRHPHFVFSTAVLMDRIWGADSQAGVDVVWTYIGFLRRKLKEIGADIEIKTVRGAGYCLEETGC